MVSFTLTPIAAAHKARIGCTDHDLLGDIPEWLSEDDPRSAVEQVDAWYQHGGGWRDFNGFTMHPTMKSIQYPGDPPFPLIAEAHLRDETILLFNGAWLAVVQPDLSHRIARID